MRKCMLWWVFVAALAIVIIVMYNQSSRKEGFGDVLGALAPYEKGLAECEKQCWREDPGKRMLSPANTGCDKYCQSTFTEFARHSLPPPTAMTSQDTCELQCSVGKFAKDPIAKDKCISMCNCHSEVKSWCRQQCAYTTQDPMSCLKECIATKLTNCNQTSWTWLVGGGS